MNRRDFVNHLWSVSAAQVLLMLLLGLGMVSVQAQTNLNFLSNESEQAPYQAPEINRLPTNWWQQAVAASPADQPHAELKAWSEQLMTQVADDAAGLSTEAKQAIRQFTTNIHELGQQSELSQTHAPLTFADQDFYSLNGVLDHKQKLRLKQQTWEEEQAAINQINNDINQQRQFIDQLIITYQSLDSEHPDKKNLGYQWLEARSWVAIYEAQIKQFEEQVKRTQEQIDALTAHIQGMQEKLRPEVSDLDGLLRQIEINQQALKQAQQDALQSGLEVAKTPNTLNTSLIDYNKLVLAESLMAEKRLELAIARDQSHIQWIATTSSEDVSVDRPMAEQISTNEQLLSDTGRRIGQWRQLAQDALLDSVAVKSADTADNQIKRTELAQQVLLKLDALDWQLEKVAFINGLIGDQLVVNEGGFERFWHGVKDLFASVSAGFDVVVNKPLFRINETPVTLLPLLRLIIIVLVGYLVSKLVRIIIKRMESRRDQDKSPVFFMLDKLIHYVIIFVATLAGFTTLGIDFTNLTLIAGALSVGIGFGLQNIVSNFVSGLTIMFERTLKVGDYIEIEDGITGTVREINARSTRINTNDNIDVVIPNSDLVTNQIINWTLRDSIKRVKIPFGVAYGTDKDLVKQAAIEAAEKVPYTLTNMKGKEPEVWMTGFGDNSLDFILLVWVSKYGVRRPNRIKAAFLWELDTAFRVHGIEIPFPQRVLHQAKESPPSQDIIRPPE